MATLRDPDGHDPSGRRPAAPSSARPFEVVPRPAGPPEEEVTLRTYWTVLLRRKLVLASTVAAVLAATVLFTLYQVPLYRAVTTLIVEPTATDPTNVAGADPQTLSRDFYETQYGIIRSDTIVQRVFTAAGLEKDAFLSGRKDPVAGFRKLISVDPVPESRLVKLSVDHPDRATAIRLANLLAHSYIDHSLEDRRFTNRSAFDWLSTQIDLLKEKLEQSDRAVLEYKGAEDVVSLERRQAMLEERLQSLNQTFNEVSARTLELRTVLQEVTQLGSGTSVESLPRILENTVVQKLKADLSELTVERAKVAERYKEKHPELVSIENQIAIVRENLASEIDKIKRSLQIEHRISEAKEESLRKAIEELKKESQEAAGKAIQYRVLQRESESNRQMYDVLLQRLREADIGGNAGGQNIRVLDPAIAAPEPYTPRTGMNLLLGLLGGLAGGVALCFLVDQVDNTLKTEEDVSLWLHEPLLGVVPQQKGKVRIGDEESSHLLAAYDGVKASLRLAARDQELKTVLLTSAVRAEGKTVSSACLAMAFARTGSQVLLVDADLFLAALGQRMRARQGTGLSDVLLRGASLESVIRPTRIPNLHLLAAGPTPPDPGSPLGSARMREVLDEVRGRYDLVILDSPPVTVALDVAILAGYVDGVVLVVKARSTPRRLVRKVSDRLHGARAVMLGVVLTWAEVPPESSYDYYSPYRRTAASTEPPADGRS